MIDRNSVHVGVLLTLLGAGALWLNRGVDLGTAARVGPGFFPAMLGVLLATLGVVIAINGALQQVSVRERKADLRPTAALASLGLAFAVLAWTGQEPRTALVAASLISAGVAAALGLRPMALVLGPVAGAGLAIEHLGLVPTAFLLVAISGLASREGSLRELAILAALTTLFASLVFSAGLGLPIPLWPV